MAALENSSTPQGKQRRLARQAQKDTPKWAQEYDSGQQTMPGKAHEFFQICDTEGKGFIARCDMQVKPTFDHNKNAVVKHSSPRTVKYYFLLGFLYMNFS